MQGMGNKGGIPTYYPPSVAASGASLAVVWWPRTSLVFECNVVRQLFGGAVRG